jgi:hypothetical protein
LEKEGETSGELGGEALPIPTEADSNSAEEETSTTGDKNQRVNRFPLENLTTDAIPPQVVNMTQEE